MISIKNLSVVYGSERPLDDITIDISDSPAIITGPSGSGKSTLLRVLSGLQRPSTGTVEIDGSPVNAPSRTSAGDKRVSLIHQDYRLIQFLSITENLQLAAELRGVAIDERDVQDALIKVGLEGLPGDRLPATLSGGEQQRVAIARAIVCKVSLLLADEPTGALDTENTTRVANVLVNVGRSKDAMVVVATHDPLVAGRANVVYSLDNGALIKD